MDSYKLIKTGYSVEYIRKTLIIQFVMFLIISIIVLFIIHSPVNWFIFTFLFCFYLVILAVGLAVNKYMLSVNVKIYENKIAIYKSTSFLLKPADNELQFVYGRRGYDASVIITYDNIASVRKVSGEEMKALRQLNSVPMTLLVRPGPSLLLGMIAPLNRENQLLLNFISDYKNVAEIMIKELTVPDKNISMPNIIDPIKLLQYRVPKKQEKEVKLLVSIKNPYDFISEINKHLDSQSKK